MELNLVLPKGTMCAFVNYVYATPDGMSMGSAAIDGDDLFLGRKVCLGAERVEENNEV